MGTGILIGIFIGLVLGYLINRQRDKDIAEYFEYLGIGSKEEVLKIIDDIHELKRWR